MASIKKRDNGTYLITVSCGYDMNNRQIRRTMTYKPDGKMTPKQIEKEVIREAVLFEEECQNGLVSGGNTKLAGNIYTGWKHSRGMFSLWRYKE